MALLLYWIVLNTTGVPNEVASKCVCVRNLKISVNSDAFSSVPLCCVLS